jgi:hypothetical protein
MNSMLPPPPDNELIVQPRNPVANKEANIIFRCQRKRVDRREDKSNYTDRVDYAQLATYLSAATLRHCGSISENSLPKATGLSLPTSVRRRPRLHQKAFQVSASLVQTGLRCAAAKSDAKRMLAARSKRL